MKKLSLVLFVMIGLHVQAQRTLEKETPYQAQLVKVDLAFASAIEMKTWNEPTIKIQASVQTEDRHYTEMFELEVNSNNSTLEIGSNSKEIFEAYREEHSSRFNDLDHEFNYTLFVPEGVKLELSSVTGSFTSNFLHGDIRIDLVTGDVDVKKFRGHLNLKSVTGKIDLPVKGSSFSAKTVTGTIRGDGHFGTERKTKFLGEEVNRELIGSQNRLTLNTVTGNINLQ